jgi:hypothetical protein
MLSELHINPMFNKFKDFTYTDKPIRVAEQSRAWVFNRLIFRIAGSNSAGDLKVNFLSVICCQVETSATDRSLVQRNPTESGVSECDRETRAEDLDRIGLSSSYKKINKQM